MTKQAARHAPSGRRPGVGETMKTIELQTPPAAPRVRDPLPAPVWSGAATPGLLAQQPDDSDEYRAMKALFVDHLADSRQNWPGLRSGDPYWGGLAPGCPMVLVDVRQSLPGLVGRRIASVRCYSPYFGEAIGPAWVIPWAAMQQRESALRASGLLAMGPREAIAVTLAGQDGDVVEAFVTDEYGRPRKASSVSANGWQIKGPGVRFIADLHRNSVAQAIGETLIELACETQRTPASPERMALLHKTLDLLRDHQKVAPPERSASGAIIERSSSADGNVWRYCQRSGTTREAGWVDYPTYEDAWYFGVFVHWALREIVTYAEGDVMRAQCLDRAAFDAELSAMAQFYGPRRRPAARAIETDGTVQDLYDALFERPEDPADVSITLRGATTELPVFLRVRKAALERVLGERQPVANGDWQADRLDHRLTGMRALVATRGDDGVNLELHTPDASYRALVNPCQWIRAA